MRPWKRRGKGYGLPQPFLSLPAAGSWLLGRKTVLHEGPPHTPQGLPGTARAVRRTQAAAPGTGGALLGASPSHCCVSYCPPLSQLPPKRCLTGLVSPLLPPALSRLQLCRVKADPIKLTPWDVLASPKSVMPSSGLSPQQQSPEQGIQSISHRHPGPSQIPAP